MTRRGNFIFYKTNKYSTSLLIRKGTLINNQEEFEIFLLEALFKNLFNIFNMQMNITVNFHYDTKCFNESDNLIFDDRRFIHHDHDYFVKNYTVRI